METGRNSQGQAWAVQEWEYPDGGGEVQVIRLRDGDEEEQGASWWDELKPEERELQNRQRAGMRARNQVRRLARANALKWMYTLTFPGEGVHDYDQALTYLQGFIHRKFGEVLQGEYLAVPELHPAGHGWHWHLLTGRRVDVNALRMAWTRWMSNQGHTPTGGAVFLNVEASMFTGGRHAGQYAAKYVSKGFEVPPGRQRYLRGEGLTDPTVRARIERVPGRKEALELAYGLVGWPGGCEWWVSWNHEGWAGPDVIAIVW